ncbi:bifunctional DNA primase/polymerase [Streptomyces sp. SudanB66_2053]|uniref:bifunctional DNA primase/polymerase n=2 Tax=Streptomyces TaxID=1883 RepID=UPI003F564C68
MDGRAVAMWFAARGMPVHPLARGRKTPAANCPRCVRSQHPPTQCPCHRVGRWCHGFHGATTDPDVVSSWWTGQRLFGVGVSCGPANLVVLDVDAHTARLPERHSLLPGIAMPSDIVLDGLASGYDTLALLSAYRRQPNPAEDEGTLRVRTPSGGLHIWYRNPRPGLQIWSSAGSSSKRALAWQVDVRAHGGYIVAPGTTTAQGVYTPVGDAREPAALPAWLASELIRTGHVRVKKVPLRPPSRSRRQPTSDASPGGLDALLAAVRECAAVPEGASFTEKLNRAAYTAGGLVGAGRQTREPMRQLLLDAAQAARPWQMRRNENIVDAALNAGESRPLFVKDRHE